MVGEITRPVWVEVDLNNLRFNFKQIKKFVKKSSILCPVVKANAYGHGVKEVCRVLTQEGAERFAVALPEEGKEIRENGFKQPIHVLGEVTSKQIPMIMEYDLIPTVCKMETVNKIQQYAKDNNLIKKIHIKIDTGMGRIGVLSNKAVKFILDVNKIDNINIEGLITHFATADEKNKEYTKKQWTKFKKIIDELNSYKLNIPIKHAANSAAILNYPTKYQLDMVRPGIIIYGLYPSPLLKNNKIQIKPVLKWKAKIIYLKTVSAGCSVSYGANFITNKETKIATIPLGYADGFSRSFSNKGEVLIKGKRAPVIGTVCMDQFMVDVSGIENVDTGDEVVLIGSQGNKEITADELAQKINTINYEIVCGISERIPRFFKK